MKGNTIAVANQKGGVCKTTTTLNLGHALASRGYRVLLIDFDPQANLTMCFRVDKLDDLETTIPHLMMSVIEEDELPVNNGYIIQKDNFHLLPTSIELSAVDVNLVSTMSREFTLRNIIEELREDYDYIIIDCMPSLAMLTKMP